MWIGQYIHLPIQIFELINYKGYSTTKFMNREICKTVHFQWTPLNIPNMTVTEQFNSRCYFIPVQVHQEEVTASGEIEPHPSCLQSHQKQLQSAIYS